MGGIKDTAGDSNSGIASFDFVESRTSGPSYVKPSRVWFAGPERRSRIADFVRPSVIEGASSLGARATGDCALGVPRLFFFNPYWLLLLFPTEAPSRRIGAWRAVNPLSFLLLFIFIFFRGVSEPRGATERSISRFPPSLVFLPLPFLPSRAK